MTNRISTVVSVFGAACGVLLLFIGVREYRSGGSALRVVAGAVIAVCTLLTVVRDVQRLRRGPAN